MTEWEQHLKKKNLRLQRIYWVSYCFLGLVIAVVLAWSPVSRLFAKEQTSWEEPTDDTFYRRLGDSADAILITCNGSSADILLESCAGGILIDMDGAEDGLTISWPDDPNS